MTDAFLVKYGLYMKIFELLLCNLGMCFPYNCLLERSNDLNLLLFYFIYFLNL